MDAGSCVKAAVLDFSQAFDMVLHLLLLTKIESYGFPYDVLWRVSAFSTGRKQWFMIHGHASEYRAVTSGGPQGSVVGPALFLIHINDIGEGVASKIRLFC